jgi:hypothetical protein
VEIIIEMPIPVYDGFVDKCDQASREYEMLKNAFIVRRPKGDRYEENVEIRCDLEEANKLLSLATQIYPNAVADISRGIASSVKRPRLAPYQFSNAI